MLIRSLFAFCSLVGYSCIVAEASSSVECDTDDAFLKESCNYVGKCREIDDPRQHSPSRSDRPWGSYESSPKISRYQRQLLNEPRRNGKIRGEQRHGWERLLVRNLLRRHEDRVEKSRRSYEGSGRRSFNGEPQHLRSSSARRFYWEPIFDGTIIAMIGSLFPKSIKDESNRERLERDQVRKTRLLQKYTDMLNDPLKLDILKKESKNSPTYINQIVR